MSEVEQLIGKLVVALDENTKAQARLATAFEAMLAGTPQRVPEAPPQRSTGETIGGLVEAVLSGSRKRRRGS